MLNPTKTIVTIKTARNKKMQQMVRKSIRSMFEEGYKTHSTNHAYWQVDIKYYK